MTVDRPHRLWLQAGLRVRRPQRLIASGRPRPQPPTAQHHAWGLRAFRDDIGGSWIIALHQPNGLMTLNGPNWSRPGTSSEYRVWTPLSKHAATISASQEDMWWFT